MKTHGLWRFHFEARMVREQFKDIQARWWVEDEIEKCRRMISVRHLGYGRNLTYSNADAIVACAWRYRRRFGGVRTVEQWNDLVDCIATRCGFTHHATLKSAKMCPEYRGKSPIFFHESGEDRAKRPFAKFDRREIEERLQRFVRLQRARRLEQEAEARRRYLAAYAEMSEAQYAVRLINQAINAAKAAIKGTP